MTTRIIASTFDEAYVALIGELLSDDAQQTDSRVGPTTEILGGSIAVLDASSNWAFSRLPSPFYAAGELMWYLSWSDSGEQIKSYAPSYSRFLGPDDKANGAYGPRWKLQISTVLDVLRKDPTTRQAVLQTWQREDLGRVTNDCPCTLSLQFLQRNGMLDMVVTMRSNDAWLGLPYDFWCFTTLQQLLAEDLGIHAGRAVHTAGSMHAYKKDHAKLAEVANSEPVQAPVPHRRRIPQGSFVNSCYSAALLEHACRHDAIEMRQLEDSVASVGLDDTVLGCAVALCWMNRFGFVETKLVPDALLAQAHMWTEGQRVKA